MKALKYTAIGLSAVIAAIVLLLFVGIPARFIVSPLQDRVLSETGYVLKVSGSAKLSLLPTPGIVMNGISLRDPNSSASDPLMTAERVQAQASLKSLFGERPRITEIIIDRPVIRAPLIRQRTAPVTSTARNGANKPVAPAITVDHVAVHDGTVMFVNAANSVESKLEKIELVGSLAADDQLDVIVSARSGDQNLRIKLKGKTPAGGFDGRPIPLEFAFEAPGILQAALSGSTEIRATGSLIRFNNLNGFIGTNKFSGWASVDAASKPLVKVELDFQKLDIGAAHAAGSGTSVTASSGGIDQPWSSAPISFDGLNFVDAEVQISAAALNVETFHFAPISVSATISNGIVRAAFPQMGLYGGQATGGIAIDASRPEHSYAIAMNIVGVRALPLLTDVANFTSLDGRMQANIDLRAWGQSQRTIMSSLDGTLSVLLLDGEVRSVNIAQMIRNVGASILSGWQAGTSEKTDFAQLGAGFRFQNGQATTNNLQFVGPLVRVTGTGTADIGAKTLQFKLDPKLVMSIEGQGSSANPAGLGVPVMVQGSWGQPKIYPEFAGMLDNPDAAFAKLRELGLGLFGNAPGTQTSGGTSPDTGASAGAGGTGTLIQGIGDMLKNLGTNRTDGAPAANRPATSPAPATSAPAPATPTNR